MLFFFFPSRQPIKATPKRQAQRRFLGTLALCLGLLEPLAAASAPSSGPYEASLASLAQHPLPRWYDDAKLGIFVHWGPYAVPAFAPDDGKNLHDLIKGPGLAYFLKNNPYVAWYKNTMQIPGSRTAAYHELYYPDTPYERFADDFNAASQHWDPHAWASLFRSLHANYVVLTTKHHDGFTLWPSAVPHPTQDNYHAERSLVAELAQAVKAQGMRWGVYYSGGFDWSFTAGAMDSWLTAFKTPESPTYINYAYAHLKELIDTTEPSLIWNDIGMPAHFPRLDLWAYYYNKIPDGVINDRWQAVRPPYFMLGSPQGVHYDFATKEYEVPATIQAKKWEATRDISMAFGYNKFAKQKNRITGEGLIHLFCDVVAKNGNLLINVGPKPNGDIPDEDLHPLRHLAAWLDDHAVGLMGSRPYKVFGETIEPLAIDVRYTRKDAKVYAYILGQPQVAYFKLSGIQAERFTKLELLGYGPLSFERDGDSYKVFWPQDAPTRDAYGLVWSAS